MFNDDPLVLKKKQSVIDVGQRAQLELINAEIRRNKETLTNLRLENTQLNVSIKRADRGKHKATSDDYLRSEEEHLHNKLCLLKRSLNSVKGKKEELMREIERTVEETKFALKEGDTTIDENSAVGQKIRALENRLDKCLIKHNEVNAIRRTYETLLERLQQEQVGFDTQLAAMEKTLQNKEKDLADLNNLANDAASGLEKARSQMLQLKTQLTKERREQKKDIEERHAFVNSKRELLEKRARRLQEKIEKNEERRLCSRSTLTSSQKKRLRANAQKQLQPEELELRRSQREAYTRLKDVTMGSNVAEVIFKLNERRSANAQLQATLDEAKKIDDALKEERARLQKEWDELQQQGGIAQKAASHPNRQRQQQHAPVVGEKSEEDNVKGGARGNAGELPLAGAVEQRALVRRRVLEEFESHLVERKNELEEMLTLQDAIGRLFMNVDAGVHHLAEKLGLSREALSSASLANLAASESISLPAQPTCSARGKLIVELLQRCRDKLREMLSALSTGEVDAAAKCIKSWRGPEMELATRVRPNRAALRDEANNNNNNNTNTTYGADEDDSDSVCFASTIFEPEPKTSEVVEPAVGSRKWLGAAAVRSTSTEDFPENEIHDRNELKMMSIATVERERKKAKKLLQQRSREENS